MVGFLFLRSVLIEKVFFSAGFSPYPGPPAGPSVGYAPGPTPGYPPAGANSSGLPPLPQVPTNSLPGSRSGAGGASGDNVDFDELTRRFEELKKKK